MHGFFSSIFGLFLSPVGVLILAALDSSMLFFLPAALDTAVVIMSARNADWFWIYPILATIGSVIGAGVTFKLGCMIGDAGLKRWIPERKLKRVRDRIGERGAIAMAVAAILPPPFPLTPFVLTCGALGFDRKKFFLAIATMRFLRFGAESVLARIYGRQILGWLDSDTFEFVIAGLMILALVGTALTIVQVIRRVR
jgi:membrane protein YqaA with SNARE-associated domain